MAGVAPDAALTPTLDMASDASTRLSGQSCSRWDNFEIGSMFCVKKWDSKYDI